MKTPITFRWLGAAGIELAWADETLVVDPFFTRPSFWRLWFGRVAPDESLAAQVIDHCDYVLVTHPHYDHLMDAPGVVRRTGATVRGSPHACALLAACGVPDAQIGEIRVGDRFSLGPFQVKVLPAEHIWLPGFGPGPLRARLAPPLRLRDYRMDVCYSFLIAVGGVRLLNWSSVRLEPAVPADVLLMAADRPRAMVSELLQAVQPRLVIPIHWDDFLRPLSRPVRALFRPPRLAWPPLQRIDLAAFARVVARLAPGTRVLVPEMFRVYDLCEEISPQ